jgi:hypothetical protein
MNFWSFHYSFSKKYGLAWSEVTVFGKHATLKMTTNVIYTNYLVHAIIFNAKWMFITTIKYIDTIHVGGSP